MAARRGFTLLEMMMASALLVLLVGGTLGAFVGIQRMTKRALAEAELSVGMREIREKLLFHLSRPTVLQPTPGLLSGQAFSAASCRTSDWMSRTVPLDWSQVNVGGDANSLYFIGLTMTINGVARRERVTVPVFGVEQTGGLQ